MNGTSRSKVQGPRLLLQAFAGSLAIGILAFAYAALPFLERKDQQFSDILSGDAPMVGIGVASVLMFLIVLRKGICRRVLAGASATGFSTRMFGGFFLVCLAVVGFWCSESYRLATYLDSHGVPTQARLVRTFTEGCGRTGCVTGLEYAFVPKGRDQPATGRVSEGNVQRIRNPAYVYAVSTGSVPILYDPVRPGRSMVYWRGEIHRRATLTSVVQEVLLLGGFLALGLLIMAIQSWAMTRRLLATAGPRGP